MTRPTRVRALMVAGALLGLLVPALATSTPAQAAGSADCSRVYAGPRNAAGTANTGYFNLSDAAGSTVHERLLVANPASVSCSVQLARAVGKTAVNSGNSYVPFQGRACTSTACWIEGLPATIRVKPRSRISVPFSVRVPAGATAGQYLAGIVASPVVDESTSAGAQVQMRVTTRVAVGVGVQVAGTLSPKLTIPSVTVDTTQPPARTVHIVERNTGNTWEHPTGTFVVHMGAKTVQLPLTSNTLLAHNDATLTLGAEQVPAGSYRTEVELHYFDGAKAARWSGTLTFAQPTSVQKNGSTVIIAPSNSTGWMVPLLVGTSIGLGGLVLLLLLLLRRRRRTDGKVATT